MYLIIFSMKWVIIFWIFGSVASWMMLVLVGGVWRLVVRSDFMLKFNLDR